MDHLFVLELADLVNMANLVNTADLVNTANLVNTAYLVNTADLVGMIQDFRRGLGLDLRRVIPLDNRPSLAIMKRKQQQIRSEGTPFSNDDQQNF